MTSGSIFIHRKSCQPVWLRRILAFAVGVSIVTGSGSAAAQSAEEQAVQNTVNQFFQALAERDRALLASITLPGSLNISTSVSNRGAAEIRIQNYKQLLDNLGGEGPALLERVWNPTILIRRDIATFWAPYDFHVNGVFSHCGIDSFQLIKRQEKWFLTNLSWTVERENCEESPLGPPTF
ncbi:MAG: hypothetical protein ACO3M2_11620 [Pseudohongiellaceae bacterium]